MDDLSVWHEKFFSVGYRDGVNSFFIRQVYLGAGFLVQQADAEIRSVGVQVNRWRGSGTTSSQGFLLNLTA
ncbi:hypothetical protein DSO57_1036720 [Entomophthora muscae]|uniref:Uncharacterized protein n=1 Tax=Entomophthora muscae TaxID=34485 RepID=A0ACC2RQ51_9FUNG|nr:hypothetical protein DSO57_1036720 [Entomophthora muscae]